MWPICGTHLQFLSLGQSFSPRISCAASCSNVFQHISHRYVNHFFKTSRRFSNTCFKEDISKSIARTIALNQLSLTRRRISAITSPLLFLIDLPLSCSCTLSWWQASSRCPTRCEGQLLQRKNCHPRNQTSTEAGMGSKLKMMMNPSWCAVSAVCWNPAVRGRGSSF